MSKIDEMRRRREAEYAQRQQRHESEKREKPSKRDVPEPSPVERPNLVVVPPIVPVEVAPVPPANDAKKAEGKCSVCGKNKPMQNGVVASHQKGLGKMCAGSRKPPA